MSRYQPPVIVASILLWGVVSTLVGCAANERQVQWEADVREAQRLHDRGQYSTAERRYRKLLERADDVDDRRHVRLQLAKLMADRGDIQQALREYERIWSEPIDDSAGARAMYEASRLVGRKRGRPEKARAMRRRLMGRYPESAWAERSVEALLDHHAGRGAWEALRRDLDALYDELRETPLADHILQSTGETLWQKGDRPEAALAYFHRVIDRHPDGRTVDDAEWAAARIYLRRQAWDRAIPLLDRLAARVDASWMVGTLNSPHASKARFELGWIHLLFLDNYPEAIDHFQRYLSDFPRNRRTDDSAWHLAHAHRLAGQMRAYRRALKRVIEEFPESRYVERARQQLEMMQ